MITAIALAIAILIALAWPAAAQKDRMSLGETLGAQVVRAPQPEPPAGPNDRAKLTETITIEKR